MIDQTTLVPHCRALLSVALIACSLATLPRWATACSEPPEPPTTEASWPECELLVELVPLSPTVTPGEPFDVMVVVTNAGLTGVGRHAPPYHDDRMYYLSAVGCVDADGDGVCESGPTGCPDLEGAATMGAPSDVEDDSAWLFLDDAWSPFADDPTSGSRVFRFLPRELAPRYSVAVDVSVPLPNGTTLTCRRVACIASSDAPEVSSLPTAAFLTPSISAEGGSDVPFALEVSRNDYPDDAPLTVRIVPSNDSDPRDIFPLVPAHVSTVGVQLEPGESRVEFECRLHQPCFVGARNDYAVTIHSGPVLLWDSRSTGAPLGRAMVGEAPVASLELIEILGAGCGGGLSRCESGTLHLRAMARNPAIGTPLTDLTLRVPLPEGLSVARHELHFHDNPLDAVTPTPAQLAAGGSVVSNPGEFTVSVPSIASRFDGVTGEPVRFADVYEIELFIDLPQGGMDGLTELVFAGFSVEGWAAGRPMSAASGPLVVEIGQQAPPDVSAAGATEVLRIEAEEGLLSWGECSEFVDSFTVFRGALTDLPTGSVGACVASELVRSSWSESEEPGEGAGFFYLVGGENCVGVGSLGESRRAAEVCP